MGINETVAYNVRRVRRERGLSLDALARDSGVSKSMLGQIERGEVNPTVSVLDKVADGLKIPLERLLERMEEPELLLRDAQVQPVVEPGSTAMRYDLFRSQGPRGFECYRMKLLPGFRQNWEPAIPGAVKYLVVFDGQIELQLEHGLRQLRQYDCIRFAADAPHSCRNSGDRTVNLCVWIQYPD